jgi:hypothetical protein
MLEGAAMRSTGHFGRNRETGTRAAHARSLPHAEAMCQQ